MMGAAGDTTTTDSRSRRNRASRRGGQLLTRARSSSYTSACPHIRAPGASVPDGRTIHRNPLSRSRNIGTATLIPVTNAIEALNSKLRRAVRARGHFPNDEAATKLLYLVLNRSEKEWRMPPREWTMAKAQFAVIFGERFIKAMTA